MEEDIISFHDKLARFQKSIQRKYTARLQTKDFLMLKITANILDDISVTNFRYTPEEYVRRYERIEEKLFDQRIDPFREDIKYHLMEKFSILYFMDMAEGVSVNYR